MLDRLAALAQADGIELRLRITGSAVMLLEFHSRTQGTRDVDVLEANPSEKLAHYAAIIAHERNWPERWLNDSAKKFEREAPYPDDDEVELHRRAGLVITRPSLRRLLAWKLDRYMDAADRGDAAELLRAVLRENPYNLDSLLIQLLPHLPASKHKNLEYNLEDAWVHVHDSA